MIAVDIAFLKASSYRLTEQPQKISTQDLLDLLVAVTAQLLFLQ
jgi:hypothetical protein